MKLTIGKWAKNKKTGKQYMVFGMCINTTNANDGQTMVLYQAPDEFKMFCREEGEFRRKFEVVG